MDSVLGYFLGCCLTGLLVIIIGHLSRRWERFTHPDRR